MTLRNINIEHMEQFGRKKLSARSRLSLNEGGYDYKFIEEPSDSLKCLICLLVVREPQQHGGCGKLFCKSCITKYRRNDCPHCRQPIRTSHRRQYGESIFNDFKSDQEVKSLLVYCTTSCPWVGELRSVEDHEKNKCENTKMPCPNACNTMPMRKNLQLHLKTECLRRITICLKCEQDMEYRDLNNHMSKKCPKRQYTCPHCNEAGVYEKRTTTHLEVCPKVQVSCLKCFVQFSRCDQAGHILVCPNEPVRCKYSTNIGCAEKPLRKDLTNHEENAQMHLEIAADKILKLTNMLVLKNTLTFKVYDFKEKRENNTQFLSTHICTSESGYKMCIKVDANGYDEAKGTHVSVFAHLMKGDNDDSLSWPFTGTVTIELLNQLEDKNHREMTLTYLAEGGVSQRVVDDERGSGWGYPEFVPHADLAHKPLINTQYLKDDTLIFRVSAEAPDYKPWLECAN